MTSERRGRPEELACDIGEGMIARRQLLSRLGLLGVAAAVSPALLPGCSNETQSPTVTTGLDAYVDFRTKPNGDPPPFLDTGQPVDYIQRAWNPERKPQIRDGALVPGALPDSGAFANYYQAQLGSSCHSFGTSWSLDAGDGSSTPGVMCLAAWAGVYSSGTGMTVPRTPAHIVIDTMTGIWQWWISDGLGNASDHLQPVKSGKFSPPASDGRTVWETAVHLDIDRGRGHLNLPGEDLATGTRQVTLTDSEIATALAILDLPATTIGSTQAGAEVVMVEHFAKEFAASARYPRFRSMWASTQPGRRSFDDPPD